MTVNCQCPTDQKSPQPENDNHQKCPDFWNGKWQMQICKKLQRCHVHGGSIGIDGLITRNHKVLVFQRRLDGRIESFTEFDNVRPLFPEKITLQIWLFYSFSPNPFWRNFDFHILPDFNLTTESGISESPGDTVMPVCRSRIRVHHKNSTGCAQPVSPAIDFVVESWIRTHSLFNQNLSEILSYWKQEFILHPIFPYRQFDLLTHIFHHLNQNCFKVFLYNTVLIPWWFNQ